MKKRVARRLSSVLSLNSQRGRGAEGVVAAGIAKWREGVGKEDGKHVGNIW